MLLLALLVACATPEGEAPVCNEVFEAGHRDVSADHVPYRWCSSIEEEAARMAGPWTCTSTDGQLDDELVITVLDQELDGAWLNPIEVMGEEIEVVSWYLTVSLTSPEFTTTFRTTTRIFAESDGDRSYLFDDEVRRSDVQGELFPELEEDTGAPPPDSVDDGSSVQVQAWTRDPLGTEHKVWRLDLSSWVDGDYVFECR